MSTSSTVSVPLILIGESSQRAIVFMIELPRGQALSIVFMNSDIITGLVYDHMTVEPMVVQNLDENVAWASPWLWIQNMSVSERNTMTG